MTKKEKKTEYRRQYKAQNRSEHRAIERGLGKLPHVLRPEIRELCRLDLRLFLKSYFPKRFQLSWSVDHLEFIAEIQAVILHGGTRARAMPRGSGKTTIVEGAAIWGQLYGHRQFLQIIAATAGAATQILGNIQAELQFNDILASDFPEAIADIRALEGVSRRAEAQTREGKPTHLVWTRNGVRLPATAARGGAIIAATGITGAVRGAKFPLADGTQVRPDLCLIDDFQTRGSAKSPNQTDRRLLIIQSDVLGLAGPGNAIACLATCTIIYKGDGAAKLLDHKLHPEWQGTITQLMRSMPSKKAEKLWDEYADVYRDDLADDAVSQDHKLDRANVFYLENQKAMDDGAVASWPARKSDLEINAIQHAMNLLITRGEETFYAEYQNAPRDPAASDMAQLEPEPITRRLNHIKPGVVPTSAIELVAYIDVGEHALWWGVGAFGDGFRGDIVNYGAYPDPGRRYYTKAEMVGALKRAHPAATIQASWHAALTALCSQLLDTDWQDETGQTKRIPLALIDAGYGESTDTVFDFCKRSAWKDRLFPSRGKGFGAKNRPMADSPKEIGDKLGTDWRIKMNKARKQREVLIGVNYWKSFVAARLLSPMGGPGCLSLPGERAGVHEMIANHFCSEKRVRVTAENRTVDEWVWKPGQDNDLFDVAVGLHVAASIRGINVSTGTKQDAAPVRMSFADQQKEARKRRVG